MLKLSLVLSFPPYIGSIILIICRFVPFRREARKGKSRKEGNEAKLDQTRFGTDSDSNLGRFGRERSQGSEAPEGKNGECPKLNF